MFCYLQSISPLRKSVRTRCVVDYKKYYDPPDTSQPSDDEASKKLSPWQRKIAKKTPAEQEAFRKAEAARIKLYRAHMSEERRQHYREKSRIRQREYNRRRSAQKRMEPEKTLTRREMAALEQAKQEKREYWRRKKRESRARMPDNERKACREDNNLALELLSAVQSGSNVCENRQMQSNAVRDDGSIERDDNDTAEPHSSDIVVEYNDMNESQSSDTSEGGDPTYHPSYSSDEDENLPEVAQVLMACDRMALSRVRAAFPKKRSRKINVLKGLLRTASPPVKKALQTLGLVCSPQTAERHIACELVVRQIPQLNSVELLINIGDSLTRCE